MKDSAAGRSCVVNSLVEGFYLNQNAVCIRSLDENVLDQRFLGYLTKYYLFQHFIQMRGRGAANQMRIAISSIKEYSFVLPEIDIQHRIADILSSYDYLIENNQKQIKLLEEAAQRLYKEWFVDLRFPGFETTPIVDGVPEGWQRGILEDVAVFKRGKTITKAQSITGSVPVIAGGIEPAYYTNIANTSAPVITVSGSGNAGFVKLHNQPVWASDCSYLDSQMSDCCYYVYCFLKSSQALIYSLQKGACQQHVYAKDINALKMLFPNPELIQLFESTVAPVFSLKANCTFTIENAKQSRDRLLPKLMSGKLEV